MKSDLSELVQRLTTFTGRDLTTTLGKVEASINGITRDQCDAFLESAGAGRDVLTAAAEMKRLAGQINVTIHALGILLCLPKILQPEERVEYVSLGAGNTGRLFDLETNFRIAEFKFIRWRGGAETIRQNGIFKDFFFLARHTTPKTKHLYLLGKEHALKFLNGRRSLESVLGRNDKLQAAFRKLYGEHFRTVQDYYSIYSGEVRIEDVSPWLSELAEGLVEQPDEIDPFPA